MRALALIAAILGSAIDVSTVVEKVPPNVASDYSTAIRVLSLGNGARAVVHPLDDDMTHLSIGASLLENGNRKQFTAAQWLASESLPPQMRGQVFTIASLSDGAVASVAWMDAKHNVHGDLVLLDRALHAHSYFEIPGGVRDVVAGPDNTLLIVAFDAARQRKSHDASLLALYSRNGRRLAEGVAVPPSMSVQRAITTAQQARLVASADRYYLVDPLNGRAISFRISLSNGQYRFSTIEEFQVSKPPAGTTLATAGILGAAECDGALMLIRQGYHLGKPATLFVKYTRTGSPELLGSGVRPWNNAFYENGLWKGVFEIEGVPQIQSADLKLTRKNGKGASK